MNRIFNSFSPLLYRRVLSVVAAIGIVLLVNWLVAPLSVRWDLTADKRFTLAPVSRQFLKSLSHEVLVKVYLSGELNAGFTRLKKGTAEMLDELNRVSVHGVRYQFVDPNQLSKADGEELMHSLESAGLGGVPVFEATEDGRKTRSVVFPYALVQVGEYDLWVNLLQNVAGLSGDENLNHSLESIEYQLMEGIRKLISVEKPRIAFLEGQGELDEIDVVDVTRQLSEYFEVERGSIGADPAVLHPYRVLIVAKPSTKFKESEKFAIDQYLMKGGRILWLVDAVNITTDSLRNQPQTIGLMNDYNLEDQLFRYGIRLNPEVVEDIQSGMIPVSVSRQGEGSRIVPMPWLFAPLLGVNPTHPVSRNLNAVKADFAGTLDTVGDFTNLRRTVLLRTSRYTRVNPVPVFATLTSVHQTPRPEQFNRSFLPVAILQEGIFPSVFTHRAIPQGVNAKEIKTQSVPTRMIVVADGDIIRNEVRMKESPNPKIIPLGWDELTNQNFGNKSFVVNAVQFLADDQGWMLLRNRNFTLRLLNKELLGRGTTVWKLLAIGVPLLGVGLTGLVVLWWRRRKYGR